MCFLLSSSNSLSSSPPVYILFLAHEMILLSFPSTHPSGLNSVVPGPGQTSLLPGTKPHLLLKGVWDLAAHHPKANKQARLVERKVRSISDAVTGMGGGWTSVQRLTPTQPPTPGNQWGKSFYRQKKGATCRNSTVSSDSHLQTGHRQSDQCHLNCLKYN